MKNNFELMDTFMIRVPTLPIDLHFNLIQDSTDSYDHIFNKLPEKYYRILKEAIQTSSFNFYNSMINFENDNKLNNKEHFTNSEYKYFIRATSRCTPYGLFSSVAFGNYSNSLSSCELDNPISIRYAKPDMCWLFNVIKELEIKYRDKLFYKINEAAVINHGRVSLLNSTQKNKKITNISIKHTKAFDLVYNLAKDYVPFVEIINELKKTYKDCNTNKFKIFLDELINNEYLISNLRPPLTKHGQFKYFLDQLKKVVSDKAYTDKLVKIYNDINLYNKCSDRNSENLYNKLTLEMQDILKSDNYLQIDTKANFINKQINKNCINELNELINILMKFNSKNVRYSYWKIYKEKFLDFYGENRLVKLIDLIDENYGIGLPNDDKNISYNIGKNYEKFSSDLSYYFYNKYCYALKNGLNTIEITDEEIDSLNLSNCEYEYIPESLELNLVMMKEKNKFIFELGDIIGSPAAGKSFGRFSHMMDEHTTFFDDINNSYKSLHTDNDYITCEVSLVPSNERSANVICNNHRSEYEISLSTANSHDIKTQLSLDDIMVGLENDKFKVEKTK